MVAGAPSPPPRPPCATGLRRGWCLAAPAFARVRRARGSHASACGVVFVCEERGKGEGGCVGRGGSPGRPSGGGGVPPASARLCPPPPPLPASSASPLLPFPGGVCLTLRVAGGAGRPPRSARARVRRWRPPLSSSLGPRSLLRALGPTGLAEEEGVLCVSGSLGGVWVGGGSCERAAPSPPPPPPPHPLRPSPGPLAHLAPCAVLLPPYLVDPASSICLSQRLSHACLSTHGRYSETANGSLNQLWFLWSLAPLLLG